MAKQRSVVALVVFCHKSWSEKPAKPSLIEVYVFYVRLETDWQIIFRSIPVATRSRNAGRRPGAAYAVAAFALIEIVSMRGLYDLFGRFYRVGLRMKF